jgi:hypothetical protein
MAHLSAQMPTGVEATSTLPPEKYTPDVRRMEAPTRKLLYGPVGSEKKKERLLVPFQNRQVDEGLEERESSDSRALSKYGDSKKSREIDDMYQRRTIQSRVYYKSKSVSEESSSRWGTGAGGGGFGKKSSCEGLCAYKKVRLPV